MIKSLDKFIKILSILIASIFFPNLHFVYKYLIA
jgi:hypothetical protein